MKYLVKPTIGISGDLDSVVASSSIPAKGSNSIGLVARVM